MRGLARIASTLQREIDESMEALRRPIAESEQRIARLRRVSEEAVLRVSQLRHLFDAEEERLARTFEEHRARFRAQVEARARGRLAGAIDAIERRVGRTRLRSATIREAANVARDELTPWLSEEARLAEDLYRRTAERLVALGNGFLDEPARTGALGEAGALPNELRIEEGFRVRSKFYFSEMMTIAAPVAPGVWLADLVSPRAVLRRRVARAAEHYLERLLASNTAGVTEDLRDRVRESRRGLEGEIRRLLRRTSEVAERARANASGPFLGKRFGPKRNRSTRGLWARTAENDLRGLRLGGIASSAVRRTVRTPTWP
jgi:hypothetical protein